MSFLGGALPAIAGGGLGFMIGGPAGAAIGAGLGDKIGGGHLLGGKSIQTTTTNNAPWGPQQPYLTDIFGKAQGLYNQNLPLTPNLSANTQAGIGALANNPNVAIPGQFAADTLNGKYLNANPYLDATFHRAFGQAANAVNSNFEGTNRYGSGAHAAAIGSMGENLANDIYGQNYQQERQNQMAMAGMAPSLINAPATNMLTAGQIQDQFNQQRAMDPYQRLGYYQGAISGNYGGTGTVTSPIYRNQGAGILGGVLAGNQLAGTFGLSPGMGAGAGALLGLL